MMGLAMCKTEGCDREVQRYKWSQCLKCYQLSYYYNRPLRPFRINSAKETPGYQAAHQRVRAVKGHAKDYLCACGCGEQARDWALKAGTENVLYGPIQKNRTKLTPYSLNPEDYVPMTSSHHKAYDARARREVTAA